MESTMELVEVNALTVVRDELASAVSKLKQRCEATRFDSASLSRVNSIDEGWIFDSTHNVTGSEFNKLVTQMQAVLSDNAEQRKSLWSSLVGIYDTIGRLDKEYLSKIERSFEQINKNYKGIKANNEEIRRDQKELKGHRERISQLIQGHELTLNVLKQFKARIDRLSHLEEIDKLYELSESHTESLKSAVCKLNELEGQVARINETIARRETGQTDVMNAELRVLEKKMKRWVVGMSIACMLMAAAAVVATFV